MKLIKQSFEFINQTDFSLVGIKKHIERCARVSYKSENKITDTSYEKFVNMLESRGHDRPLEFGTVYLTLRGDDTDALRNIFIYAENPWTKIRKQVIKAEYDPNIRVVLNYVTTNYRVIVENHLEEDLKYLCEPTEYHYKRYTAHMILDRGVMDEFRTHVGLSHLAESTRYCVSGDTLLKYKNPLNHYTIRELWEDKQNKNKLSQVLIGVLNIDTGILEYSKIKNIFNNSTRKVYKITTELGYSLKCTSDHQIYTPNDWKSLSELKIGDKIYVNGIEGPIYQNKIKSSCEICGATKDLEVHHKDKNHSNNPNNLMTVCSSCHQKVHNQSLTSLYGDKIIAITELGEEEVFDLEIENYHNYVANGIIVHNCNYSKDKFDNEVTFIKPCWLDDEKLKLYGPYHTVIRDKSPESIFIANLNNVERDYLDLIKLGWTPQQARSVLPLGIKSELISCGFKDAWENFFKRRDAPDAHPMAQEIADPMHKEFFKLTKAEQLS